jgi:hypothetical protein
MQVLKIIFCSKITKQYCLENDKGEKMLKWMTKSIEMVKLIYQYFVAAVIMKMKPFMAAVIMKMRATLSSS